MKFSLYHFRILRRVWLIALALGLAACNPSSKSISKQKETECVTDEQLQTLGGANGIIGGQKVDLNDHFAKRVVVVHEKTGNLQCSGTPITPQVILTAAHCFSGKARAKDIRVAFHPSLTCRSGFNVKTHTLTAASYKIHENYANNDNDIALVRLSEPIPEGFLVTPLYDENDPTISDDFILAGFGITLEGASDAVDLRTVTKNIKAANLRVDDKELLFDQSDSHGVCSGDSGGPLFLWTTQGLRLAGVNVRVSNKGNKQRVCRKNAFSTYVPAYRDWIEKQLQEWK